MTQVCHAPTGWRSMTRCMPVGLPQGLHSSAWPRKTPGARLALGLGRPQGTISGPAVQHIFNLACVPTNFFSRVARLVDQGRRSAGGFFTSTTQRQGYGISPHAYLRVHDLGWPQNHFSPRRCSDDLESDPFTLQMEQAALAVVVHTRTGPAFPSPTSSPPVPRTRTPEPQTAAATTWAPAEQVTPG